MKKRILPVVLVLTMILLLGMGCYSASAAGSTNNPRFVFFGQETNIQVVNPFNVTWGAAKMYITGGTDLIVWPGQRIAAVPVKIENRSPFDYSAQFSVSPLQGDWPGFDVIINSKSPVLGTTIRVGAGQTVEADIEVRISMGAQVVKFKGLTLEVSPGPPLLQEKG